MKQPKSILPLIADDPWLEPYQEDIEARLERFKEKRNQLVRESGSLEAFASAYTYYGLNYDGEKEGWWFREWAPAAQQISLVGDFNEWDRNAHPLSKNDLGDWEIFLPLASVKGKLVHGSLYKIHVVGDNGALDRIPAYANWMVQDSDTHDFSARVWHPTDTFVWSDREFDLNSLGAPIIYESHTGMAQEEAKVGTFREFADQILPRIHKQGYNTLQMMAIQEHPYYGSFGYHVSNFFAPSSRFGSPDDLRYLVNKAHQLGIAVVMDIVHSHAVKNIAEGLDQLDGSDDHYFHPGGRGYHTSWDSKLFNYGKREVLQFLLSNVAYWIKEFHFDGFRFDGVTSMMYFHHGDFMTFDHYDKYFREGAEWDAITYLQLANDLVHTLNPAIMTIAEDMSGMPGLCRKNEEGGLGFDYRLGMGIPDFWIKLLKHSRDEDWDIHELWHVMTNRRYKEKTIAYAESHDQALVGDKTLAFWLMDKEMYWHMNKGGENLIIDRGIALHKMIRLFTAVLGGEGYLNFMGNEFGHPEWVDFPREGNGWSYQYARRQWSLADHPDLKYEYLNKFDQAMVNLLKRENVLSAWSPQSLNMDTENQTVIAERNNLIFAFNFHASHSIFDYQFSVPSPGDYQIILCSDDPVFGGHNRINTQQLYPTDESGRLHVYLTQRTVLVLKKTS